MQRAKLGGLLWLLLIAIQRPNLWRVEWGQAVLLLAAFSVIPLVIEQVIRCHSEGMSIFLTVADRLQFPSAGLLGLAFIFPQGTVSFALAVPWAVVCCLLALAGIHHLCRQRSFSLANFTVNIGLCFASIGGAWLLADRLGYRPLEFDPVIVLLTAIHFHYAGLTLPVVTGLSLHALPRSWYATTTALFVTVGVPAVAAGITATRLGCHPLWECAASIVMGLGGLLEAGLLLRLACEANQPRRARFAWLVASGALFFSMNLAILFGLRAFFPIWWLDIPMMRALHGTANAIGFAVTSLVGWSECVWRQAPGCVPVTPHDSHF